MEIEALAASIRRLLEDRDADLSRDATLRWQGALTALEVVLGEPPSLAIADWKLDPP